MNTNTSSNDLSMYICVSMVPINNHNKEVKYKKKMDKKEEEKDKFKPKYSSNNERPDHYLYLQSEGRHGVLVEENLLKEW